MSLDAGTMNPPLSGVLPNEQFEGKENFHVYNRPSIPAWLATLSCIGMAQEAHNIPFAIVYSETMSKEPGQYWRTTISTIRQARRPQSYTVQLYLRGQRANANSFSSMRGGWMEQVECHDSSSVTLTVVTTKTSKFSHSQTRQLHIFHISRSHNIHPVITPIKTR